MECYVCLEENCYTLSPCKCTNLSVHPHCYAEVVANFKECGVCREPFCLDLGELEPKDSEDLPEASYFICFRMALKLIGLYITLYLVVSYFIGQNIVLNGFNIFITTVIYVLCMLFFGNKI